MEGIYERADMDKPFMGLPPFWRFFALSDIGIVKNYLREKALPRSESGGIQIICFHDREWL